MRRLVVAEVRKLLTTRLWLWLLLASAALTALFASLAIAFDDAADNATPPLSTAGGQQTLFSVGAGTRPLIAVLAAIALTGEFRHRTASATFLATPHRGRVVLAKLLTYAVVGAAYGVVCIVVTVAIAVPWLSARGVDVALAGNGIPATLAGVVAVLAIFGLVGVALGALVRDQVATVVGLLIYLFVVEPVLTNIPALQSWTIYLPGAAANAVTQVVQVGQDYLEAWQGGIVLAGYALAFAALGTLFSMRRDVT